MMKLAKLALIFLLIVLNFGIEQWREKTLLPYFFGIN